MRGKKRPIKERARAVGIALMDGAQAASDATGIPRTTILRWTELPEYDELRQKTPGAVSDMLWAAVQIGVDQVAIGLLDANEPLRDKAVALGILYDKHALLNGMPTGRTESKDITHDLDNATRQRLTDWIDSRGLDTDAGATDSVPAGAGAEVREPAAV